MRESGLSEIIPLICTLAIQGQCPAFLHPESPQAECWDDLIVGNMHCLLGGRQYVVLIGGIADLWCSIISAVQQSGLVYAHIYIF